MRARPAPGPAAGTAEPRCGLVRASWPRESRHRGERRRPRWWPSYGSAAAWRPRSFLWPARAQPRRSERWPRPAQGPQRLSPGSCGRGRPGGSHSARPPRWARWSRSVRFRWPAGVVRPAGSPPVDGGVCWRPLVCPALLSRPRALQSRRSKGWCRCRASMCSSRPRACATQGHSVHRWPGPGGKS